jgi:hypothetical protein
MAFAMEGGIGEGAGPQWNAWGGRFIIVWGNGISDKKIKKNYVMALNGHQTRDIDATINKKRAHSTGGMEHDVRAVGSMEGGTIRSFPWQPCEVVIKIKIN